MGGAGDGDEGKGGVGGREGEFWVNFWKAGRDVGKDSRGGVSRRSVLS